VAVDRLDIWKAQTNTTIAAQAIARYLDFHADGNESPIFAFAVPANRRNPDTVTVVIGETPPLRR